MFVRTLIATGRLSGSVYISGLLAVGVLTQEVVNQSISQIQRWNTAGQFVIIDGGQEEGTGIAERTRETLTYRIQRLTIQESENIDDGLVFQLKGIGGITMKKTYDAAKRLREASFIAGWRRA